MSDSPDDVVTWGLWFDSDAGSPDVVQAYPGSAVQYSRDGHSTWVSDLTAETNFSTPKDLKR